MALGYKKQQILTIKLLLLFNSTIWGYLDIIPHRLLSSVNIIALGLYRYFRDVFFFREADPDNASTEEIVLTEAKAFFKLAVEAAINYPHVR
jgi:hypothetical protein